MQRLLAVIAGLMLLPALALPAFALAHQHAQGDPDPGSCASPTTTRTAAPAADCLPTPRPAAAYTGHSSGCTIPDPTGTGGCITPTLAHLHTEVDKAFGHLPAACWSARAGDPYSDHPRGRACDYTIGHIGTYPGPDLVAHGWTLANWLRGNADALHVNYVIWHGRIWSQRRAAQGWRPYTGGDHYRADGPTYGHYDHVHVSTVD